MSTEPESTTTRETPEQALTAELQRYGDALLPGAAEILGQRNALPMAHMTPDKRAERVAELVESKLWANFRNSEHKPAVLENGQPVSPLRAALIRNQDRLKEGQVDLLVDKLAPQMVGKSVPQLAGAVVKWLATREADDFKVGITTRPAEDALVSKVLSGFGDVLDGESARKLVIERRRDLERLAPRELTALVARALTSSSLASRYGARTIASDDPRLNGRNGVPDPSRPEPVRQADGRFASPPAAKPSGRSSGGF